MRKYELSRKGKLFVFGAYCILSIVLLVEYVYLNYNVLQMFGTVCLFTGGMVLSEIFIQDQMRRTASFVFTTIMNLLFALCIAVLIEIVVRGTLVFITGIPIIIIEGLFSFSFDFSTLNSIADALVTFLDNFPRLYCIVYCVCLPLFAMSFEKMEEFK